MSTKTNFKRVALVAVAALGLGLLSSVPSQAAVVGVPTITTTNGDATRNKSDSTTAATLTVKFNATAASDSVAVRVSLGSQPATGGHDSSTVLAGVVDTATSTGGLHTFGLTNLTSTGNTFPTDTSVARRGIGDQRDQVAISAAVGQVAVKFRYYLDSSVARVAGTYTFDYFTTVYSAGVAVSASAAFGQFTIVVTDGALAAAGSVTAGGTSSAIMYEGSAWSATTVDSSVSVASTPDATADAVIRITQKTAAGLPARESITVTTNIGNLGFNGAGAAGKSLILQATTDGIDDIEVYADGTSGTATITIKTTSVTFANKSVVFFSTTVSKITTTVLTSTIGSSAVDAILAVPTDATGNNVRTANAVYAYSDATTVINTGTSPAGTSCGTYNTTYGGYLCSLTGSNAGTANITIRNAATSTAATVASSAVPITVNTLAPASFKLEFDKATYAPGEVAYVIVRPLDSAGQAVGGQTITNLIATGGITLSKAPGEGSPTTVANLASYVSPTVSGKIAAVDGISSSTAIAAYKIYMPSTGGAVKVMATGGSALPAAAQVEVSATATVTDNGAAALAAVNALATTVASLRTLITTLTNLVLKIQKKVKA